MFTLPDSIHRCMEVFKKNGFQIYIVGGAVRDLLLGKSTTNWDFTTNATPEEIKKLFPDSFYHNTYGTVSIPEGDLIFEVTPFRKESGYTDKRHPETIEWATTIDEDLARRDFTINAMAYDGKTIVDIYNGQNDLNEKCIRAVGDPHKRFAEDALRLMRGVRLAAQLGFSIEPLTLEAITSHAQDITHVSWERIRDEFLKILSSEHAAEGVLTLRSAGLLQYILPELDMCFTIPQKSPKRHHLHDVGTHLVKSLEASPSTDPITRFATLIHDIGKVRTYRKDPETQIITFYNHEVVGTHQAKEIAARFRLSKKESEKLIRLVKYHQFTVSELQTDKAVRRFIREIGKEYLQDMLDLRTGDRIGGGATPTSWRYELFKKRLEEVQKEPFKVTDLKIDGKDVMDTLRIDPGPQVGEILKKLFDQVVEGTLKNEREILLDAIKK